MLSCFFRVNMPYGIERNVFGEWACFNREYKPLGICDESFRLGNDQLPIFAKYKGITEEKLLKIACDKESIRRDQNGFIEQVWLYNDGTNPVNVPSRLKKKYWDAYFQKIMLLSEFKIDNNEHQ